MKRMMLMAAALVLVGGFAVGCKKKTESEKLMDQMGATADQAGKAADEKASEANKTLNKLTE